MPGPSPDLLATLAARLGQQAVLCDPSEIVVYESDGSRMHDVRPAAVVFPRGTEEVAFAVRTCAAAGVPFVARGAGTGLSGGAMALDGGVVLALNRMTRILALDARNRRAMVEPGVANLAVSEAAAEHGLFYAPDPSSQAVCTLGGNVAHNSGGPHTLKYGTTVNHVLGLQLVLPDGEVVEVGGSERPGYDLLALLTGAEGTLGIVTAVTVRLLRRPEAVRTLLAAYPTVEAASSAVSAALEAGLVPAAMELLDAEVVAALSAAFGLTFPEGAGALLLLETDGPLPGLDAETDLLEEVCRRCGALSVRRARDEKERAELWTARKKAFGALGRIARHYATQDGVIPRTRLPEVLADIRAIAARHGLRVANVFHAGDGNLHPCLLFDDDGEPTRRHVVEAGAEILRRCLAVGGALSGEHGIGIEKREWMSLLFSEADLSVQHRLRQAFDPRGLCNPKKILPLGAGAACGELFNKQVAS